MSQPDAVVYEFECGRRTFRASVSQFRGEIYLDLREWFEPEPGQDLKPTKKGIALKAAYIEELREAVDALATAAGAKSVSRNEKPRRSARGRVSPMGDTAA